MADGFAEFLEDHRAEHRSAFNQWCLVLGDTLQVGGLVSVLQGRWRRAALLTALGFGVGATGHVRDGNLAKSLETARLHPLWNIRGDLEVARDMISRPGQRRDAQDATR